MNRILKGICAAFAVAALLGEANTAAAQVVPICRNTIGSIGCSLTNPGGHDCVVTLVGPSCGTSCCTQGCTGDNLYWDGSTSKGRTATALLTAAMLGGRTVDFLVGASTCDSSGRQTFLTFLVNNF